MICIDTHTIREEKSIQPTQYNRLNKDDAAVLLVDHQAGLVSLVQDYPPNEFKNNILALNDAGFPLWQSVDCSVADCPPLGASGGCQCGDYGWSPHLCDYAPVDPMV